MVNPGDIRQRLKTDPFVPFNLVFDDGDRVVVEQPELIRVTRDEVFVFLPPLPHKDVSAGLKEVRQVSRIERIFMDPSRTRRQDHGSQ